LVKRAPRERRPFFRFHLAYQIAPTPHRVETRYGIAETNGQIIAPSMEVTMSTLSTKFATGFFLAAAIVAVAPAGSALAQDSEAIRAKCIGLAGNNNLTGNAEDNRGRYRLEVYTNCMRQHGLNP
jgi:hypothetical protein